MRQISADEEEKVGRIQQLMLGYADGVEANRKLLEAATSSVDDPDMAAFVQVGALNTFHPPSCRCGNSFRAPTSFLCSGWICSGFLP